MSDYVIKYYPPRSGEAELQDTWEKLTQMHSGHLQFERGKEFSREYIALFDRDTAFLKNPKKLSEFQAGATAKEISASIQNATGKKPKNTSIRKNEFVRDNKDEVSKSDIREIEKRLNRLEKKVEQGEVEEDEFEKTIEELRQQAGIDSKPEYEK